MDDIRILPTTLDTPSLFRSCEALARHMESGDDLGDRSHHIRMLGLSLEAAHRSLHRRIAAMRALPPIPDIDTEDLCRSVEAWAAAMATCRGAIEAKMLRP